MTPKSNNEFILVDKVISKRQKKKGGVHTFNHPPQLNPSSFHHSLNPPILPRKELDKLDGADEFIENTHTFVSCCTDSLLNTDGTPRDKVVQRPANQKDDESGERRYAEEPAILC